MLATKWKGYFSNMHEGTWGSASHRSQSVGSSARSEFKNSQETGIDTRQDMPWQDPETAAGVTPLSHVQVKSDRWVLPDMESMNVMRCIHALTCRAARST